MGHADRERLLLRTPGPVLFGRAYVLLVDTNSFPNLLIFRTMLFEYPSVLSRFCLSNNRYMYMYASKISYHCIAFDLKFFLKRNLVSPDFNIINIHPMLYPSFSIRQVRKIQIITRCQLTRPIRLLSSCVIEHSIHIVYGSFHWCVLVNTGVCKQGIIINICLDIRKVYM